RQVLLGGAPANRRVQVIDVPAPVGALLARMLGKRPEDRPQTPAEVATEIADLVERGDLTPSDQAGIVTVADEPTEASAATDATDWTNAPAATEATEVPPAPRPTNSDDELAFDLTKHTPRRAAPKSRRGIHIAAACMFGLSLALCATLLFGRAAPVEDPPPRKEP